MITAGGAKAILTMGDRYLAAQEDLADLIETAPEDRPDDDKIVQVVQHYLDAKRDWDNAITTHGASAY